MINDLITYAERIESIIRRTNTFGKSKEDILLEFEFMAQDLRKQADHIIEQMEKEHDFLQAC
jgi:hemerythrin-like domain-containing protein